MSDLASVSWAQRAADRSPSVQRSRTRSLRQAQQLVEAARRLIVDKGDQFTTQDLAKEAGVAVQTFYRYFSGKDHLLLAVIEDLLNDTAADYARAAADLPDPLTRVHYYVSASLSSLGAGDPAVSKFVTAQHWRLHQLFPEEMAQATRPITDLIATELRAAKDAGMITSIDVDHDASCIARLIMSTFHFYAFAPVDEAAASITEHVWSFCLRAVTGVAAASASDS